MAEEGGIAARGPEAVRMAFANQVAYCAANDAPLTARIVDAVGALIAEPAGSPFLETIADWPGPVLADAVPLRAAAGLHALHLSEAAPELSAIYAGEAADDRAIVADVICRHEAALLPWLEGPPQTNEAGRSSSFIAAMLWLADQGLPPHFQCLEIGSSAGINLMLARYRYDLGGVVVGPDEPVMAFTPEWRGPPPPAAGIEIASTRGCDVAPVDLRDAAQELRLKAYIWPEHAERFRRLEAAIATASESPPDLVLADAAAFVEAEVAKPQESGTTRLLMHSIVWQYVPADQQARITAAMEGAGARATADRPLAWVALEANRTVHQHELRVRYWPGGGGETLLGRAHAHGAWLEWLAA